MFTSDELQKLYNDIRECHICPRMEKEKALRLTQVVNPGSDVFIVSQTLAEKQVRKTGVNFFTLKGKLGKTGSNLEKFLNKFNRTVFPYQEVQISSNATIPKCKSDSLSVYSTDIAQCYPGKKNTGKGDRSPKKDEIQNCITKGFLLREIELMKPKLILLMGKSSRNSFFEYVLHASYPRSLSAHISEIVQSGRIPQYNLGNRSVYLLPIQHASGANPRFFEMVANDQLIEMIRAVLGTGC